MTDQNHRDRALEFALKVPGPTSNEDIIRRAKLFAAFLNGDQKNGQDETKVTAA